MDYPSLFRRYLLHLGYGKTTVQMVPNCIKDFMSYVEKPIAHIDKQDIICFYNYLKERPNQRRSGGLSDQYIQHHVYALKQFYSWLELTQQIAVNPMSGLRFPSPKSKPRTVLTFTQIQSLYQVTQTLKERAFLGVFYGCGLRRSEAERLNLKDIHFTENLLYVRQGKSDKRRVVPLSKNVHHDLKQYALHERFAINDQETSFLCNTKGSRMKANSFQRLLKKLLDKSNLSNEITLHSLRHSIATHLLENGVSIHYVRDFLGHRHLESTQVYTHVNPLQLWQL